MTDDEVRTALGFLEGVRDAVLANARIDPGSTVVDVGAGTGLLTLGAADAVGPDGDIVAVDVSADALGELRRICTAPNVAYLVGSADVLPLMDASVDVILTRSVLIYVRAKEEAAREFFRALRPGGRCSIFEPLNVRNERLSDVVDFGSLSARVKDWESRRLSESDDPMLDFDEQDLVRCFRAGGFAEIMSELRVTEQEIRPDQLLSAVGAPGRRSLAEEWSSAFSADEVARLRESVNEHGNVHVRWTGMYLFAEKP